MCAVGIIIMERILYVLLALVLLALATLFVVERTGEGFEEKKKTKKTKKSKKKKSDEGIIAWMLKKPGE